jgi:hypothetical protein
VVQGLVCWGQQALALVGQMVVMEEQQDEVEVS